MGSSNQGSAGILPGLANQRKYVHDFARAEGAGAVRGRMDVVNFLLLLLLRILPLPKVSMT